MEHLSSAMEHHEDCRMYLLLYLGEKRLKDQGIMPLSFFGIESMEPSVIGWMPAAAIYFRTIFCL